MERKSDPSIREPNVDEATSTNSMEDFQLTINAEIAGSPQLRPLAATVGFKVQSIIFKADDNNTGKVFIGGLAGSGRPLTKGQSIGMDAPKGLKLNSVGYRGDTANDILHVWYVTE